MKRIIISLMFLVYILCGCGLNTDAGRTEPTDSGHDHHAPQVRNRISFFTEEVRHEGVDYYLSYNEPDGCVTRVGLLTSNQDKPSLFYHNDVFYFFDGYYDSNRQEMEGNLKSISITGQGASLLLDGEVRPSAIIRVDDSGVYCEADDGQSYFRIELDLSAMEPVSAEEALTK